MFFFAKQNTPKIILLQIILHFRNVTRIILNCVRTELSNKQSNQNKNSIR